MSHRCKLAALLIALLSSTLAPAQDRSTTSASGQDQSPTTANRPGTDGLKRNNPVRHATPRDAQLPPFPPELPFHVSTQPGTLTFADGSLQRRGVRPSPRVLALWQDRTNGSLFVYTEPVETRADLGAMLSAMINDLDVDLAALDEASELIRGTPLEHPASGSWQPATRDGLRLLMGLEGDPQTPDVEHLECGPIDVLGAEEPPADLDYRKRRRVNNESPRDFESDAVNRVIEAACTGGGGPGPCTGPCCEDPCCGDPCCGNPCCNDRCCQGSTCCGSSDPCCNQSDPCCGNPDRCCNPDNPCCGSSDPCCNQSDPCCGNSDPCCNPDNPDCNECQVACCHSSDPCCNSPDPCCGSSDPCCGSTDPCCGSSDPCCGNEDPCDPDCGNPCDPSCIDCDDDNECTIDSCDQGQCEHLDRDCGANVCCSGEGCCAAAPTDPPCCGLPLPVTCCPDTCCVGTCVNNACCPSGKSCPSPAGPECCNNACDNCLSMGCCGGIECPIGQCCDGGPCYEPLCVCQDPPDCQIFACELRPRCDDQDPCTIDNCSIDECDSITCTNELIVDDCVDLTFDGLCHNLEENPGGFIALNDDDDDGNETPDRNDTGPTPGENDLKMLTIEADGSMEGTLTLSAESGGQKIRVWQNPDRTGPVPLPVEWVLFGAPKTFFPTYYVEGVEASGAVRDVELKLMFTDINGSTCQDVLKLTVFRLDLGMSFLHDDLETDPPGFRVATNNDFDEYKYDTSGIPQQDLVDLSPMTADESDIPTSSFKKGGVWVYPNAADVLDGAVITLFQTGGTGSVRMLAIQDNPVPPLADAWTLVPFGSNLRDDFLLPGATYPISTYPWYAEGLVPGQVELTLRLVRGTTEYEDKVLLNVVEYGVIEIRYKAFIACDAVTTGWLPGPFADDIHKGDERTFGYDVGPSRTFQSYQVSVNPAWSNRELADGTFGNREGFDPTSTYNEESSNVHVCDAGDPAQVCPEFCTLCMSAGATSQCQDLAEDGQEGNDLRAQYQRVDSSLVEVAFTLVATNPCEIGIIFDAPSIDATMTFEFRQTYDPVNGWKRSPNIEPDVHRKLSHLVEKNNAS